MVNEDYELYVISNSEEDYDNLQEDVWKEPRGNGGIAHVMVERDRLHEVTSKLTSRGVHFEVLIRNVGDLISREDADIKRSSLRRKRDVDHVLDTFPNLASIMRWLNDLAAKHSDLISVIDIGKSHENRSLRVLKMGTGGVNKWAFWIDCGIHAREWIAPVTCLHIITQLLRSYQSTGQDRRLLDDIDWYILPVHNPDGYHYTHTVDRLWRKNRLKITDKCTGVDLNRNWSYKWGGAMASDNPCSIIYRGPRAASEPEVNAITEFFRKRATPFRAFVTLHSYGQMITSRWGYGYYKSRDHDHMMMVINKMAEVIKSVHGREYKTGTAPNLLYPFSGGSGDWARGVARIKYAITVELRDRHTKHNKGNAGFILDRSHIQPTGQEMFAAIKVLADQILDYDSLPNGTVTYPGTIVVAQSKSSLVKKKLNTKGEFLKDGATRIHLDFILMILITTLTIYLRTK